MSSSNKKARSKNYLDREKCVFVALIDKNKHFIENKSTNANILVKKRQIWELITQEFNSSAETPRSTQQLQNYYNNLKRQTRKIVADGNVQSYIEKNETSMIDENTTHSLESPDVILETLMDSDDLIDEYSLIYKKLKKDDVEDKKNIKATGGGTFKPRLTDVGAQMLAIMGEQIKPLTNSTDSATSYYTNDNPAPSQVKPIKTTKATKTILKKNRGKKFSNVGNLKTICYRKKLNILTIEEKTKQEEHKLVFKKNKILDLEIKIKTAELENILVKQKVARGTIENM